MQEQTTYETCLACCLLTLTTAHYTAAEEHACLHHSLQASKLDFVGGHISYFPHQETTTRIVEWKQSWMLEGSWKTKTQRITQPVIDTLVKEGPFILYIDTYCLAKYVHAPHFIIVLAKSSQWTYTILDPWDGKEKVVLAENLLYGVALLRDHLRFTPQIIQVKREEKKS
jgi:hypothetical protein